MKIDKSNHQKFSDDLQSTNSSVEQSALESLNSSEGNNFPPDEHTPSSFEILQHIDNTLPSQELLAATEGEIPMGNYFAKKYQGQFLYSHAENCWYYFIKDKRWTPDTTNLYFEKIANLTTDFKKAISYFEGKKQEAENAEDKTKIKHCEAQIARLSSAVHNLARVIFCKHIAIAASQGSSSMAYDGKTWDATPYTLLVDNGVISLNPKTGDYKLRKGVPSDRLLTHTTTPYKPNATCPRWQQTLKEIFCDDQEIISFFQRWIGYSLCKDPKEHKILVCCGNGRNGKTLLFNVLKTVLGGFVKNINTSTLLDNGYNQAGNAASPDRIELRGRSIVVASETQLESSFNAQFCKDVSGQGEITARPLYGRIIHFPPTFTVTLLCNAKPNIPYTDEAFWSRICTLEFTEKFESERYRDTHPECAGHWHLQNKNLLKELLQEKSGILNWAIKGAQEWIRKELGYPSKIEKATKEYRQEEDRLKDFLGECCESNPNAESKGTELYKTYSEWAKDIHIKAMSKKAFSKELQAHGFKKRESNGISLYKGIALLPPTPQPDTIPSDLASEADRQYEEEKKNYNSASEYLADHPL